MFRLEYLKLMGHPQLGNLELFLSEESKVINIDKPYTSVIIGPNGTGKSFILRTIAEIFRQFQAYSVSDKKDFSFSYDIHLRYKFNQNTYEIVTRRLKAVDRNGNKREYLFFKNRPFDMLLFESKVQLEKITGFEVKHQQIEYPEKLIVSSVMLTDRFVWKNSNPTDFYQYLGVRSTRSTSSTQSSSRRTIKNLLSAITTNYDFIQNLKDLLNFLEFEENFKVHYSTRINKLFFTGSLSAANFKRYYEEWWEEDFVFSKRKEENPSWSIPYYNRNFKDKIENIEQIVNFLNNISNELEHKKKSPSKILSIDLFASSLSNQDIEMIGHLESLDIINLDGIKIRKSNSTLSINDVSSGEYHLLISLIGMFTNISNNSLILIDEPEISLHPNWQMRYISFLKKVFSKYNDAHFILTTHSHFLVSDLEGVSSSVIALIRDKITDQIQTSLLQGGDTFGWSAEEILYTIFKVKTVRNYFLEADLTDLLGLISENSKEKTQLQKLLNTIKSINISPNDPLNAVIEEATEYLEKL